MGLPENARSISITAPALGNAAPAEPSDAANLGAASAASAAGPPEWRSRCLDHLAVADVLPCGHDQGPRSLCSLVRARAAGRPADDEHRRVDRCPGGLAHVGAHGDRRLCRRRSSQDPRSLAGYPGREAPPGRVTRVPANPFTAFCRKAFDFLEGSGLRHLVIGGLAVGAIGEARTTGDVDVVGFASPEDAEALIAKATEAGFNLRPEVEHERLRETGTLRSGTDRFNSTSSSRPFPSRRSRIPAP